MTTMPLCTAAPRSVTNWPMKAFSLFMSSSGTAAVLIIILLMVCASGVGVDRSTRRVVDRGTLMEEVVYCPLKCLQDTLGCQFTKAPFGLSFHAHTWSV